MVYGMIITELQKFWYKWWELLGRNKKIGVQEVFPGDQQKIQGCNLLGSKEA